MCYKYLIHSDYTCITDTISFEEYKCIKIRNNILNRLLGYFLLFYKILFHNKTIQNLPK